VSTVATPSLTVRLPVRATVRECTALKQQLLEVVDSPESVTIDATDVELIDTAALQLLYAFGRERLAKDLSTLWEGENAIFRDAAAAMGLEISACHDVA
jgi:anti-anti-sigma regulatory factor